MALELGLAIWAVGTVVLLLAVWQARPAARWTALRQEVFADLVARTVETQRAEPRDVEQMVSAVTRGVAPPPRHRAA